MSDSKSAGVRDLQFRDCIGRNCGTDKATPQAGEFNVPARTRTSRGDAESPGGVGVRFSQAANGTA